MGFCCTVALSRSGATATLHPHTIRLGFEGPVLHHGDARAEGVSDAAGTLLDDVGQLVAQQFLSLCGLGVVLARGEVNVRAPSESDCPDGRRLAAHVNAHIRKVRT